MQKKLFCVLIIFFVATQLAFAQQVKKVIISGYGGQHDLDVRAAFLIGYNSYNGLPFLGDNTSFPGEVILYSNTLQASFDYAVANDYDLIIRSTTGLSTGLRLAPNYPDVKLVIPAGSNEFVQVFFGDVITSPVVITGAGIDSNQTGYKVEFYSIDPITIYNYSSYSNGYIAGQLAFIANTLNCSFDSARVLARNKGSENGIIDFYNGFGEIYPENIITTPLPVELTSFTATLINQDVLLNWQTVTEVNNYGFEIERSVLSAERQAWKKVGFVNGSGNSNSPNDYSFIDKELPPGKFSYRLKQIDNNGNFKYSDIVNVNLTTNDFKLYQNYPNPFNPTTRIKFSVPERNNVTIKIFNMIGQEIQEIVNQEYEAGNYNVEFNASNLASGVYFYRIQSGNFVESKKMIYLK